MNVLQKRKRRSSLLYSIIKSYSHLGSTKKQKETYQNRITRRKYCKEMYNERKLFFSLKFVFYAHHLNSIYKYFTKYLYNI